VVRALRSIVDSVGADSRQHSSGILVPESWTRLWQRHCPGSRDGCCHASSLDR
jgi:hypothetical protein